MGAALFYKCLHTTMSRHPLTELGPANRVLKRAQYEAFAFSLVARGIRVRNESHRDPADHEYHVTVSEGVPTRCECPADTIHDTPCKHRVALAVRPRLLELVAAVQTVADATERPAPAHPARGHNNANARACDCAALPDDFPCWECVRTGRQDLSE